MCETTRRKVEEAAAVAAAEVLGERRAEVGKAKAIRAGSKPLAFFGRLALKFYSMAV